MNGTTLIYGASGYTGKLVAKTAKAHGMKVILAGRSEAKVKAIAESLGFPWRAFELKDSAKLDAALREAEQVLHIAGPFSATSKPMVDACLRTGRHYLDITGEIDVFEACAARDAEAKAKNVMLMPGVGFDVVPSDCLASHMKRRMPDATQLTLGIEGLGAVSRGTAKTGVEGIGLGTRARRGGKIVKLPDVPSRQIDFGKGPRLSVMMSWGDVATAWHSTKIPDIDVYFAATPQVEQLVKMPGFVRWILSTSIAQGILKRQIDRQPEGPTDAERAAGSAILIGEAKNGSGQIVRSRLTTGEGYTLTAFTSLGIARRVLAGQAKAGFQTPSLAFGPDFILEFDGCRREDLNA
jgi:short subunit dehydrogenase-like uncharacterized protein